MIKHFAQKANLSLDTKASALVNAGIELSKKYTAIRVKSDDFKIEEAKRYFIGTDVSNYEQDNVDFTESFMKYCVEGSGFEWTGMEMVKESQVRNRAFMDKFYAVTSQIITPVIPAVISTAIMNMAEVKDIALGDTAQFTIDSNELFQVNYMGEGIHMGAAQKLYAEEIVVNPTNWEIRIDMDWYFMASGKLDFGAWAYKVGASFAAHINKFIYKTMVDAVTSVPSGYKANGFSDANFLGVGQRVEAANAGSRAYCFGTKTALGKVIPSNDYLKMQLGEEWTKTGYLGAYKGFGLMEIEQNLVPGTINTTGTFGVDDTYLWFIPLGANKPVKLVFEGSAFITQDDSTKTADKTQRLIIQRRYGVKLVVGSRYGVIYGVS